jgi:hypothetical protein
MSQHDYVIENQDGASFRADINNALAAAVSLNSGATEPTDKFAFMLWQDTTAGVLKQRNAANSAWVTIIDYVAAAPLSRLLTSATVQATTSGTSKDFTSIPSWVKRITVMFNGVSTNGTNSPIIQLGDSGGIEATGYNATASDSGGRLSETTGFPVARGVAASDQMTGVLQLSLLDAATNTWVAIGNSTRTGSANTYFLSGSKALSATLDRIRVTTIGGTDAFDAGSVNILYE